MLGYCTMVSLLACYSEGFGFDPIVLTCLKILWPNTKAVSMTTNHQKTEVEPTAETLYILYIYIYIYISQTVGNVQHKILIMNQPYYKF
jgi:hypothetical protein